MVYRALEEDCCSNPGAEALTRVMSQWQESPPQPLHGWLQPKEGRKVPESSLSPLGNLVLLDGKRARTNS